MYTTRVTWEPLRSIDSALLTGVIFHSLGTPLAFPSYKCKMVNNSNVLVLVSIDGVTAIDVCPPNSFWLYDEAITKPYEALPANTQIFVKAATPGTGLIYLVTQYIIQG